jgi:hypothetical protein
MHEDDQNGADEELENLEAELDEEEDLGADDLRANIEFAPARGSEDHDDPDDEDYEDEAPAAAEVILEKMTYKELQSLAKQLEIKASGSAADLRTRIGGVRKVLGQVKSEIVKKITRVQANSAWTCPHCDNAMFKDMTRCGKCGAKRAGSGIARRGEKVTLKT